MPIYLLDTDMSSAAIKGVKGVDSAMRLVDPADLCISAVTRGELQFGLAKQPEATRMKELVAAFLQVVRTQPWGRDAADRYGTVRAALAKRGRPIGPLDEMIAAHALALDAVLVTNNERHFAQVPDLRVENWLKRRPTQA